MQRPTIEIKSGPAITRTQMTNKTANIRVNTIFRRVRATIVVVEKQYVLYIMSECL